MDSCVNVFRDPGNIGNLSTSILCVPGNITQNPIPNPYSLYIYIPALAQIARKQPNLPPPLYFCAQARYLRALGLRRGLRCPEDVSMETQVSQSVPQDCPRCSKEATKVPKRETKGAQCGPQSMPWHSKVRSKESYISQNS